MKKFLLSLPVVLCGSLLLTGCPMEYYRENGGYRPYYQEPYHQQAPYYGGSPYPQTPYYGESPYSGVDQRRQQREIEQRRQEAERQSYVLQRQQQSQFQQQQRRPRGEEAGQQWTHKQEPRERGQQQRQGHPDVQQPQQQGLQPGLLAPQRRPSRDHHEHRPPEEIRAPQN